MDPLYPSLHDVFKSEGICPICLTEMGTATTYSCANGHALCHRCKPYYYACPTCRSQLDVISPPIETPPIGMPMPTHYMPHLQPGQFGGYPPSAPYLDEDFLGHERRAWYPPAPPQDQELTSCPYEDLGCWVKLPEHLRDLHATRCQFRPNLEEEHLPTDLRHGRDDLVECTYSSVGCRVRMPRWRQRIHESSCNYRERYEGELGATFQDLSVNDDAGPDEDEEDGDPEELVECKFRPYGCTVQMPRRRRRVHAEKCNYRHRGDDNSDGSEVPEGVEDEDGVIVVDLLNQEFDPEEKVDCKWAEYGCRVRPKRSRLEVHSEKCNHRMEECVYRDNGCAAIFQPNGRFAHERGCEFAY